MSAIAVTRLSAVKRIENNIAVCFYSDSRSRCRTGFKIGICHSVCYKSAPDTADRVFSRFPSTVISDRLICDRQRLTCVKSAQKVIIFTYTACIHKQNNLTLRNFYLAVIYEHIINRKRHCFVHVQSALVRCANNKNTFRLSFCRFSEFVRQKINRIKSRLTPLIYIHNVNRFFAVRHCCLNVKPLYKTRSVTSETDCVLSTVFL